MSSGAAPSRTAQEGDSFLFDLSELEPLPEKEQQEAALSARKQIQRLLPNAKIIGDHYHFKAAIQEGFDLALKARLEPELKAYRATLLRRYRKKHPLQTVDWIKEEVRRQVEERRSKLKTGSYLLRKHRKLKTRELEWVKKILGDHASIKQAWEIKAKGLDIFPDKPRIGKNDKDRAKALARRRTMLISEAEAGRRLDDWANSIDPKLRECFQTPLNLIRHWREELIRIGTTVYSNADTESKNHFLRLLAGISRGLDFDMLRARLLWADAHGRSVISLL